MLKLDITQTLQNPKPDWLGNLICHSRIESQVLKKNKFITLITHYCSRFLYTQMYTQVHTRHFLNTRTTLVWTFDCGLGFGGGELPEANHYLLECGRILAGPPSHAQHNGNTFLCITSKYSLFLQWPDGKLTARSGAGCEATRQWPGTNRLDGRRWTGRLRCAGRRRSHPMPQRVSGKDPPPFPGACKNRPAHLAFL